MILPSTVLPNSEVACKHRVDGELVSIIYVSALFPKGKYAKGWHIQRVRKDKVISAKLEKTLA